MANAASSMEIETADTVCRYCGEDFKFYRSLKHHLRSQSSCSHKPFTCRVCDVGFSTKANCLRHIQKQHTPVAGVSTESRMAINETLLAAQQKAAATGCLSRPTATRKRVLDISEHQASKVQRLDTVSIMNGRRKQEPMETSDDDQPLDFSLKTMKSYLGGGTVYSVVSDSASQSDEPIDLSVGASRSSSRLATVVSETSEFDSSSPISLVVASRRASPSVSGAQCSAGMTESKWSVTSPNLSQCTQCHVVFKHSSKVSAGVYFCYIICNFHMISDCYAS